MSRSRPIPVFDGHNDAIQTLAPFAEPDLRRFLDGGAADHVDLPRARKGGFAGGMFAISASSPGHRRTR